MSELSKQEALNSGIERAAVAFAFDYGPLAAAGRGEVEALETMRAILVEKLACHGLKIVPREVEPSAGVKTLEGETGNPLVKP